MARVLADARAEMVAAEVEPEAVKALRPRLIAMARDYRDAVDKLDPARRQDAPVAVALGCSQLASLPEESALVVKLIERLAGQPLRLLRGCCGMPWMHAGDRSAMQRRARDLKDEARGQSA